MSKKQKVEHQPHACAMPHVVGCRNIEYLPSLHSSLNLQSFDVQHLPGTRYLIVREGHRSQRGSFSLWWIFVFSFSGADFFHIRHSRTFEWGRSQIQNIMSEACINTGKKRCRGKYLKKRARREYTLEERESRARGQEIRKRSKDREDLDSIQMLDDSIPDQAIKKKKLMKAIRDKERKRNQRMRGPLL